MFKKNVQAYVLISLTALVPFTTDFKLNSRIPREPYHTIATIANIYALKILTVVPSCAVMARVIASATP